MNRTEFLEDRNEFFLETCDMVEEGGLLPLFLKSSRRTVKEVNNWKDAVHIICFLVKNRMDAKHVNCCHTPARSNYKQWCSRRDWYTANIKGLSI